MTPDQKKKIGIVVVLVIALGGVIFWQMKPNPAYKTANQNAAAAKPQKTATGTASGAAGGVGSVFEEVINLDELLASVKTIEFDYGLMPRRNNPMRPKTDIYVIPDPGPGPGPGPPIDPGIISKIRSKIVSGIMWDPYSPLAVVDNEVLALGDVILDGVIVDSIEQDRVIFRVGNQPIPVEMKEQ